MKKARTRAAAAVTLLAPIGLGACSDPVQVIEETEFSPELGVDLAQMEPLESGVYIQDIEVGTGDPLELGQDANWTYTGYLADATEWGAGTFTDNVNLRASVIGFIYGMLGMQPGGTRLIVVPPELAYGDREVGIVPSGSILVFRVTLNEII